MTETTQATQPVWPVKHSPLLRAPERFISREGIQGLVRRLTDNLVNITDETGAFLLRLDAGWEIYTMGWGGG
jgi:unsaturated rhamnogalacturonyl hydrolase